MDVTIIDTLEELIFERKYLTAAQQLAEILQALLVRKGFFTNADIDQQAATIAYTRLAQCFTQLITAADFIIERQYFFAWLMHQRAIQSVFAISGFRNTDHLTRFFSQQLAKLTTNTDQSLQLLNQIEQVLMKLLLSYSVDNEVVIDFQQLSQLIPELLIPTLWEMLATHVFSGKRGALFKEHLLGVALTLPVTEIEDPISLLAINMAWMLSSYYSRQDKHQLKRYFNQLIERYLHDHEILNEKNVISTAKDRPTLLVVVEIFSASSALYKGYSSALIALSNFFRVIGVFFSGQYDETAAQLFAEHIVIERKRDNERLDIEHFKQQVKKITDLQPDMIFYPCIGMHDACIMLANLRLAPIQVMSYGCPASSYSPYIDVGIIEADYVPASEDLYSEKLIVLPPESMPILSTPALGNISPQIKTTTEEITIIVATITYKISHQFLQACQQIAKKTQRRLRFIFMTGDAELSYLHCRQDILSLIPHAIVYPLLPLENYLTIMNSGTLLLSTFPFCGTNTVVDALCLGLPVICLRSADLSGRTDSALLQRCGLPEWLITKTADEYVNAALRLIHNEDERIAISQLALQSSQKFSLEKNINYAARKDNLAIACWKIYNNYAELMKSTNKRFVLEELT